MVGDAMVILLVLCLDSWSIPVLRQTLNKAVAITIAIGPSGLPGAIGSPCLKMPILFGEGRSLSKVLDGSKLPPRTRGLEGARATQR